MNTDSINEPKNELNHYIYEGVKGFYRITFEPFLIVKQHKAFKKSSKKWSLNFFNLMLVQSFAMEIHIELQAYFEQDKEIGAWTNLQENSRFESG